MGLVILIWTAHINYHGRRSIEEHRLILNFYRSDDLQKKYNNIKPQTKKKTDIFNRKKKISWPHSCAWNGTDGKGKNDIPGVTNDELCFYLINSQHQKRHRNTAAVPADGISQ